MVLLAGIIVFLLTYLKEKEKNITKAAIYGAIAAFIAFMVPFCVSNESRNEDIRMLDDEEQIESIDTESNNVQSTNSEEFVQTEENNTESVEIATLIPLIGENDEFWNYGSYEDNMGSYHTYRIFCFSSKSSKGITYPLNSCYSCIKGDVALGRKSNDIEYDIWIEFYGDGVLIGETAHFNAGVRPSSFEVDVSGVNDLTIVTNSDSVHWGGEILTNGFFLYSE